MKFADGDRFHGSRCVTFMAPKKSGLPGRKALFSCFTDVTFQAVDPTVPDSILQTLSVPPVKLKFYIALLDAFFWLAVGDD